MNTKRRQFCSGSSMLYRLKVLGVTFTDTLSASDHVRRVISDSAQSLYAPRVLRHMASAKLVFRQFSGRSLCLGWHTQRQRGLDLSPAQTTSASKHSFTGACDVDTARQICQTLFSWWRKRTSGYLEESTTIQATSCADCSRPRRWRHSSTVCGVVHMTDKCPITQDTLIGR